MANVEEVELRGFASREFFASGLGHGLLDSPVYRLGLRTMIQLYEHSPRALNSDTVARLIESYGWYLIGMQVGYFEAGFELDLEVRDWMSSILEKSELFLWPENFLALAKSLCSRNTPRLIDARIGYGDKSVVSLFQSVLIASQSFEDPLVSNLLEELRRPDQTSLDGRLNDDWNLNEQMILGALSTNDTDETLETLMAGFLRLIDVLQPFADLVPDIEKKPAKSEVRDLLGTLVCWRLNPLDRRVSDRLGFLSTQFAVMLDKSINRDEETVSWSMPETMRQWSMLLEGWGYFTTLGTLYQFSSWENIEREHTGSKPAVERRVKTEGKNFRKFRDLEETESEF
jgi:hypothetical protein